MDWLFRAILGDCVKGYQREMFQSVECSAASESESYSIPAPQEQESTKWRPQFDQFDFLSPELSYLLPNKWREAKVSRLLARGLM